MSKHLLVLAGPDEGRSFLLDAHPLLLGRSRATATQLIDPKIAQVHCQIFRQEDRLMIHDFDSDAGTFLNGQRISEHVLAVGDMIRIGDTRLQVVDGPPPGVSTGKTGEGEKGSEQAKAKPAAVDWMKELPGRDFGQFQVGALFAKGKTGCFFHARQIRKNLDVALKVLDPSFGSKDELVQRFNRAMKAALPLQHPNLVRVFGAGKTGPHCWVAMEYVRAENLAAMISRIETAGMFDWRNVLKILIYLARGLAYAHQQKVIHQCVTPQNILVGKNLARSKLADLSLDGAIVRDPTLPNAAGEPSSHLPYMSPERTDGPDKPIDARTDIYSLGASAYALLTGLPPFQAKTAPELVAKIRLQAPPSMKLLHFGLPEPFETAVLKMLAKRPEDRFQSAQELLAELERIAQAQNVVF